MEKHKKDIINIHTNWNENELLKKINEKINLKWKKINKLQKIIAMGGTGGDWEGLLAQKPSAITTSWIS